MGGARRAEAFGGIGAALEVAGVALLIGGLLLAFARSARQSHERFLRLRDTVFQDPQSYSHRYAARSQEAARQPAAGIGADINGVNLRENIAPTRARASLVLRKGDNHAVEQVQLRRL